VSRALIGHSGFVGSNLLSQRQFDELYNSSNFRQMSGRAFGQVFCAGVSAAKWKANKDPQADLRQIQDLQEVLATIRAERFVLISTIDVYGRLDGLDESFDCKSVKNHAYGRHRLAFEDFCRTQFANCHVVRLPGLFGRGLKKNIIFDLLNDNCLDLINPASSFQYYDLDDLGDDIDKVVAAGLELVNLFTEPISTRQILDSFFPDKRVGQKAGPEAHYDLHTCHAGLWGKSGPYIWTREEVLAKMQRFIQEYPRTA